MVVGSEKLEDRETSFLPGTVHKFMDLFARILHFENWFTLAVSKENDIFQIAKKPISDGRLVLSELKKEFC
jgi:hypothetical protein